MVVGDKQLDGDPYDIGLDACHRDHVKTALNAIINAGPDGVKQPKDYVPAVVGLSWLQFVDRVKRAHAPIGKYFLSGFGVKLQFLDSCIAETILLHFAGRGVPCLPIHDSFIMYHGHQSELDDVMRRAYRDVMKADIPVKAKILEAAVSPALHPGPQTNVPLVHRGPDSRAVQQARHPNPC